MAAQTYSPNYGLPNNYQNKEDSPDTPLLAGDLNLPAKIAEAQWPVPLLIFGNGVSPDIGDKLLVSPSTGRNVSIASGLAIVGEDGFAQGVQINNTYTIGPLPANRSNANPIYIFVLASDGTQGIDPSVQTRQAIFRYDDYDTYPGAVLLAKVTTSASAILSVVDMRQFLIIVPPATTTVLGKVKLKTAAANPANPIVPGDNDPRLTDARPPTNHATNHKSGGSDPIRLNELAAATGDVSVNSFKVTDLATPVGGNDATNKTYVDTADALKAPLASPALTGTPTAPTAAVGTNTTQIATTAHVKAAIDALIAGAPGALDTLNEIATQLATDESAAAALTTTVAGKLAKSANLSDLSDIPTARTNLGLGNVDNTSDANKPVSIAGKSSLSLAGVLISSLTTTARTAYTPVLGEIVYDTTANTFYVGDGTTAGGVASASGFNDALLLRLGFVTPRAQNYFAKTNDALAYGASFVPTITHYGNSIAAGTGATNSATAYWWRLGTKLQVATGVSTVATWAGTTYGQGGTTTANVACWVADNCDTTTRKPQRNIITSDLVAVMTMRNDVSQLSIATARRLYRAIMLQQKKRAQETLFIIDPPQIDLATGKVTSKAADYPFVQAIKQCASIEGVAVADVWSYFVMLSDAGIDLRPFYATGDNTHPSDAGHNLIAEIAFKALSLPPVEKTRRFNRPAGNGANYLCASYSAEGLTTTTRTISGNGTSRQKTWGGEATVQSNVLTTGNSAVFIGPAGARGIIVQLLTSASNTGTASVSVGGISVATGLSCSDTGSDSREAAAYIAIPIISATNADFTDSAWVNATVTAVGGQIMVQGVTWVMEDIVELHEKWPDAVEVGTWSDTTILSTTRYGNPAARQSSTVGDTYSITWYGNALVGLSERGAAFGKLTWATDGLSTNTGGVKYGEATGQDFYVAGSFNQHLVVAKNLPEGWHTTVFTVATKNGSSSGNTVKLSSFRAQTSLPDQSARTIRLAAGETMPLVEWWEKATIIGIASGAPTLLQFVPGQSTIAIGGTGAAIVRLER